MPIGSGAYSGPHYNYQFFPCCFWQKISNKVSKGIAEKNFRSIDTEWKEKPEELAEMYNKYLKHENIDNLKGLKIEMIYKWKLGETLIIDRSHIHCSSANIKKNKLGLTTFTKK